MPLLAGTASWTDPTLIACGRFYPPEVRSAEDRLRHYATQFGLAEVDSSYYALPSARNAALWAERTPAGFVFDIKAFRLFTGHATSSAALPADLRPVMAHTGDRPFRYRDVPHDLRQELWHRFRQALHPLHAAGKLGAVLFQFAPQVRAGPVAEAHIAHCVDMMAGATVAVEMRHRSWFDGAQCARTLALERELGAVHVVVDAPQGDFANTVPAIWATTRTDLAMVRLHGRNSVAWNAPVGSASSGRFRYLYPREELAAMLPDLRKLDAAVDQLHVVFNTNFEDQGQVNVRQLLSLW